MAGKTKEVAIREIPFDGDIITAVPKKGRRNYDVVFKPSCEAFNLDYSAQFRRLKRSKWATVAIMATVGGDGKDREMVTVSRKTYLH